MSKRYASKVISIAKKEVGYLEKKSNKYLDSKTKNAGRNNYTKYGRDMHKIYPKVMDFPAPWCDCFVDWCFYKAYGIANAKGLLDGNFNDYTVASAQLYKNKGAYYKSNPKVGDQIFFNNGKRINHTGLVHKVDKTYVYTVEGNTSSKSGVVANGGCVAFKKYRLTNKKIDGYGRPKYDVEKKSKPKTSEVKNYLSKGDKGNDVKNMQDMLIYCGYPCGKSGADGSFGGDTENSLKKFQKAYKLDVDGNYGAKSKAKLTEVYNNKKKNKQKQKAKTYYYKKYKGKSFNIDKVLKSINAPYGSVAKRKPVAEKNGYKGKYRGSLLQNLKLVSLAKKGKLKK